MSKPTDILRDEPPAGEEPVLDYARPIGGRAAPARAHRIAAAVIAALVFALVLWLGWKVADALPDYWGPQWTGSLPALRGSAVVAAGIAGLVTYFVGLRAGGIVGEEPPE